MLSLSGRENVSLCPPWFKRSHTSTNTKQYKLSDIPKVKPDSPSIWPAVFSNLVPDQIGLIGKTPALHHFKTFCKKSIWNPKIKVCLRCSYSIDRQLQDFLHCHGRISKKPLMFRSHLPRPVLKAPGRISKNSRELTLDSLEKILCCRALGHVKCLQHTAISVSPGPRAGSLLRRLPEFVGEAWTCES